MDGDDQKTGAAGKAGGRRGRRPPSEEDSPASCPRCAGFGLLEDPRTHRTVPCGCRGAEAVEAARRAARIPDRYRSCRLVNFSAIHPTHEHARALARRFVEEYPAVEAGLLFVGPAGRGKTHLAVAILNELVESKGVRGVFCDFSDLLDRIQSSFSRSSEENQEEIVAPFRDADLLVLDELGARRPTDWVREVLYGLLNTRYNRRRLTILTSNYGDEPERPGGESLEMRVGVPVRSRLAEMCELVILGGKDFRQEGPRRARVFA